MSVKLAALESFRSTVAENLLQMRLFNVMFAVIIAFGVVYNNARIALEERSRELATLRVIGFTRAEISLILLGELATVTAVAIPAGLVLGHGLGWFLITYAYDTEMFRIPLVISRFTYAFAAAVTAAAAVVSGLIVRRAAGQARPGGCPQEQGMTVPSECTEGERPSDDAGFGQGGGRRNRGCEAVETEPGAGRARSGGMAILAWGFVPAPVEVDLGRVGRGSLAVTVDHEGKTRVKDRYVLSSPLAGRLLRIGRHTDRPDGSDATLHAGDPVEKDKTLLAVIEPVDPALLDARAISQAQARRSAAEEGLNKAAADLERAQSRPSKRSGNSERGDQRCEPRQGISQEDLEKAEFGRGPAAAALLRGVRARGRPVRAQAGRRRATCTRGPSRPATARRVVPVRDPPPIDGVVLHVYQESATVVPRAPGWSSWATRPTWSARSTCRHRRGAGSTRASG